jgi:hypothetical protein
MSVVGGGESMVVIEVRINSFAGAEAEAVFKRTKAGLMQSMVPTALRGTSREGQGCRMHWSVLPVAVCAEPELLLFVVRVRVRSTHRTD